MSTDFPYAWGTPPWDSTEEDAWDNAVGDTAEYLKKDLKEIVREAIYESVDDYITVSEKWHDLIYEDKESFKDCVTEQILNELKIK